MLAGDIYNQRILFAVLNWGLGHATRSAPLIDRLLRQNNEVHIVSSGLAQQFLQTLFPQVIHHTLTTRDIVYPRHGRLWVSLLLQQKKIFGNIKAEKQMAADLCARYRPQLLISDNCYGFYHPQVHSVLITHQVNLQAPFFEKPVQQRIHRLLLPFTEIWVPDFEGENNLAGRLAHPMLPGKAVVYTGPLSSLQHMPAQPQQPYVYCAVVSGPEKQRTLFENEVIGFLLQRQQPSVLVRGTQAPLSKPLPGYIRVVDFCDTPTLRQLLAGSHTVIGRTGYSTIMDLYYLQKPCLLLPTPGQTEQEYLFTKHFGKVPPRLHTLEPGRILPCKG